MTLVTAQMSVSLDGFYAGPKYTDTRTSYDAAISSAPKTAKLKTR